MKSRQKFFDGTVLKKDITRFAPAWALYLIGGVMIAVSVMAEGARYSTGPIDVPNALSQSIGLFGILNMIYAMIVSQLLYGDMFNSKLCNALHAMPLRREGWFLTHLVAGLLFSLVPNLVISLSIIPFMGEYWYAVFLWLLGMQLHYLFFFGLAVFSMFCTGSRFASITVYGLLNFLALLAVWFAYTIYVPMLYGLEVDTTAFLKFSPVCQLCTDYEFFTVEHLSSCPCKNATYYSWYYSNFDHQHAWGGLGDGWDYLCILAALGVVFLALALVLYKKRRLESAGDFVAFRVMKPMFWVLFAMGFGGACQFFVSEMLGHDGDIAWVFLAIGLVLGYFMGQMLVERTVKIFKRRIFIQFGIFAVAFCLSLLATWLDPLGLTRYVPAADQVEKVYVIGSNWTYEEILDREERGYPGRWYTATETEDIEQARQVHELLIEEGRGKSYSSVTVCYVLKNGHVVTRHYAPYNESPADTAVQTLLKAPSATTGFDTLDSLQDAVSTVFIQGIGYLAGSNADRFLEALWQDAEAGNFYQGESWHYKTHGQEAPLRSVQLTLQNRYGSTYYLYSCCENALAWLSEYADTAGTLLDGMTNEQLLEQLTCLDTSLGISFSPYPQADLLTELLDTLRKDMENGWATLSEASAGQQWQSVTLYMASGFSETLYLDPDNSLSVQWLKTALGTQTAA